MTTATAPRKLFAHQKDGVKWLLACRNRFAGGERLRGCILADEMGLGKTATALIAAKVHKEQNPKCQIVVLAPKSVLNNWKREAAIWGVKLDKVLSNHSASFPEGIEGPFILISDESHSFQNPASNRTIKFLALVNGEKEVERSQCDTKGVTIRTWTEIVKTGTPALSCYLLTGTPVKNGRPHNLLPLLVAINHGLVKGKEKTQDYLFRYCGPEKVWNGKRFCWQFNGATNLAELHDLCQPAILRRLKVDCLDLPEKVRVCRQVELTGAEDREYNAFLDRLRVEYLRRLAKGEIKTGGEKLVFLGQLRRAGSLAKVNTAIEIAQECLEQGQGVAIFTSFRESAARIAAAFGVPVFDGDTSPAKRDEIVANVQAGKVKVFVGLDKAGGVGITLNALQTVILVDRAWTPGDVVQVEDRLHRIGQRNAVTSIWLQHGKVDSVVDTILQDKWENAETVLSGKAGSIEFDTADDLASAIIDALGW